MNGKKAAYFLQRIVLLRFKNDKEESIMKELHLRELSVEQKLGIVMTAHVTPYDKGFDLEKNMAYTLDLIRRHAVGCVWVNPNHPQTAEYLRRIRETADYPILICTDAESGLKPYMIGQHGTLAISGNPKRAYTFGRVTAITARRMGYNVICDPVLDMGRENGICNDVTRRMGGDPEKVIPMAVAMSRGILDGGIIPLVKHYPGVGGPVDTHMGINRNSLTKEDLLAYSLKPYAALIREKLLFAVMAGHGTVGGVDGDTPTTVSAQILSIIREMGFDGPIMTDALGMYAIVSKYGRHACKGMTIGAGCDLTLGYHSVQEDYEDLLAAYRNHVISDERLDEAARRVLALQRQAMLLQRENAPLEMTEEDDRAFQAINDDAIAAILDEGVPLALDRQARHCFVVLEKNLGLSPSDNKVPPVDTFQTGWYRPDLLKEKLLELFPHSVVTMYNEFPTPTQTLRMFHAQESCEDCVFVTFYNGGALAGAEHLTWPVISAMEALQSCGRISTLVHMGNPFILEDLPHIGRRIVACRETGNNLRALEALAGLHPANGHIPYDLKLK